MGDKSPKSKQRDKKQKTAENSGKVDKAKAKQSAQGASKPGKK